MRKLTVLLILLITGAVGISTGLSRHTGDVAKDVPGNSAQRQLVNVGDDPTGTIDGAKNPELISDIAAYSVVFRLLANRQTEDEKSRAKSYLTYAGLEGADIEAFLTVSSKFQERVAILDSQVKNIKDHNWPNPSVEIMTRLSQLQQEKEALVAEVTASLPSRLSVGGLDKMRLHINRTVKPRMKVFMKPTTPPHGQEWRLFISDSDQRAYYFPFTIVELFNRRNYEKL
jgi:hypothetical protein